MSTLLLIDNWTMQHVAHVLVTWAERCRCQGWLASARGQADRAVLRVKRLARAVNGETLVKDRV